jgi:2-oxoglutarate ferredoxin oxidoreductase subunit alpha
LGDFKQRDGVGYDMADYYERCGQHLQVMIDSVEPMVETEFLDDAELIVTAWGTPAKFVRYVVRQLRAEGHRVGFIRPITLFPFPSEAFARVADGVRGIAVYENNRGQMLDDVRLAVLGRAPVEFIGRLSLDSSAFGIAPDLEVPIIRRRVEEAGRRFGIELEEVA